MSCVYLSAERKANEERAQSNQVLLFFLSELLRLFCELRLAPQKMGPVGIILVPLAFVGKLGLVD